MKGSKAIIISVTCACLLSACSANTKNKNTASTAVLSNSTAKNEQAGTTTRKNSFFDGIVIASTNNNCIDHFNFIRGTNTDSYKTYSADYAKIGEGYRFLNINKNIMGKEAKEVYTMQLDVKLDTLCAKAHYTSYQIVKEKMRNLASI